MFRRDKAPEYWFTLVPQQSFSSQEFYDAVSREIEAQKVPSSIRSLGEAL